MTCGMCWCRFDFSHTGAMTPEQLSEVEVLVQGAIDKGLPVYDKVR